MNKVNYSKETEKIIQKIQDRLAAGGPGAEEELYPTLLLHSCCAPCSSYVMEYLREYFRITVLYYNPNISRESEYEKRLAEEKRLIGEYNRQVREKDFEGMHSTERAREIKIMDCEYDPAEFYEIARGLENCPEGGERCFACYELRIRKTAREAVDGGFDYFATTLTISPLKNAQKLNEIGLRVGEETGVKWLPSDFKKKEGYKRSIELSGEFDLYRQNFCGCVFSQNEAKKREQTVNLG